MLEPNDRHSMKLNIKLHSIMQYINILIYKSNVFELIIIADQIPSIPYTCGPTSERHKVLVYLNSVTYISWFL